MGEVARMAGNGAEIIMGVKQYLPYQNYLVLFTKNGLVHLPAIFQVGHQIRHDVREFVFPETENFRLTFEEPFLHPRKHLQKTNLHLLKIWSLRSM